MIAGLPQNIDTEFEQKLKLAYNQMISSRAPLIATHENPDGDGLGAMLALYSFLKLGDREVFCFASDLPEENLNFLPFIEKVGRNLPSDGKFDLVIGLDYGDLERLKLPREFLEQSNKFIGIDHHVQSEILPETLSLIYPELSSTSEIIFWFFKVNNIDITKEIATLLLTGILVDTGGLSHITTSAQTLKIASELFKKGVVPSRIASKALYKNKPASLKMWGKGLNRMKKINELEMIFSYISADDFMEHGAEFDDIAGLVSLMNTVSDAKIALLLIETEKGVIKGSLRSEKFKGVDVSEIARKLGGGGHKYAAGFTKEGDVDGVLEEVKRALSPIRKTHDILPPRT